MANNMDEQLLEQLQKMFNDDVKDAKDRFLRYFRYRYPDVNIDYELVIIKSLIGDEIFSANMMVYFSKNDVKVKDFLRYFRVLTFTLCHTYQSYWPHAIGRKGDIVACDIDLRCEKRLYERAYMGYPGANVI